MKVRTPVDFSAVIRSARKARHINQQQLAAVCGTTQSAISRLEKTGICHIETLLRACAALQLQLDISPLATQESAKDEVLW